MNKKNRHHHIIKLIESTSIQSQQELLKKLTKQGIRISQSTLSKDLKELGIVKVRGSTGTFRFVQTTDRETFHVSVMLKKELISFLHDSTSVNNLVILKTVPGNASGLSKFLDEIGWPEVVGTMASVDTVLAITRSNADAKAVLKRLQDIIAVR